MSDEAFEAASQIELNKAIRVLRGDKPLKYTVCLYLADGKAVEFQSPNTPMLSWNEATRTVWLYNGGSYGDNAPIMEWIPGTIMTIEENPK